MRRVMDIATRAGALFKAHSISLLHVRPLPSVDSGSPESQLCAPLGPRAFVGGGFPPRAPRGVVLAKAEEAHSAPWMPAQSIVQPAVVAHIEFWSGTVAPVKNGGCDAAQAAVDGGGRRGSGRGWHRRGSCAMLRIQYATMESGMRAIAGFGAL